MPRKVNLGCGEYKQDGFVNIDKNPLHRPDVIRDVRKGLPFDDSSVDEVLISHFLEHLTGQEIVDLMEEVYRVLKPSCMLRLVVPLADPYALDHLSVFNEYLLDAFERPETATYFQKEWLWTITHRAKKQNPRHPEIWDLTLELRADK